MFSYLSIFLTFCPHLNSTFYFPLFLPFFLIQVRPTDYNNSGFDRGHMAPAADFASTQEVRFHILIRAIEFFIDLIPHYYNRDYFWFSASTPITTTNNSMILVAISPTVNIARCTWFQFPYTSSHITSPYHFFPHFTSSPIYCHHLNSCRLTPHHLMSHLASPYSTPSIPSPPLTWLDLTPLHRLWTQPPPHRTFHPISSLSSHLIPSHLLPSHPIPSHLISSHLISSHPICSHPHLISSYLLKWLHRLWTQPSLWLICAPKAPFLIKVFGPNWKPGCDSCIHKKENLR